MVVYEHQRLKIGQPVGGPGQTDRVFEQRHWDALASYTGRTGSRAFGIGHRTITVGHHVGYLQVGTLRMELLPKLRSADDWHWRALLLHMLREVLDVRITAQPTSPLHARAGSLYHVLVDRFLRLVEGLMREGLQRAYWEEEDNGTCMRGRLLLTRHLRENVVHRERLAVAYPVFDADTLANRALHQALLRVRATTSDDTRRTTTNALLGAFPEVGAQRVRPEDFARLQTSQRAESYAEALELARLLLAAERPDLHWGGAPVISLLFDMNALFEGYVLRQLRRIEELTVHAQASRPFWQGDQGTTRRSRPDLVVQRHDPARRPDGPRLIIDTKWKIPSADRPSNDDLRQLFAYLRSFKASEGLLLYPCASPTQRAVHGTFTPDGDRGGFAFLKLLHDGKPDRDKVREELRALLHCSAPSQVCASQPPL